MSQRLVHLFVLACMIFKPGASLVEDGDGDTKPQPSSSVGGGGGDARVKAFPKWHYTADPSERRACSKYAITLSGGIRTFAAMRGKLDKFVLRTNHHPDIFAHMYLSNDTDDFQQDWSVLTEFAKQPHVRELVVEQWDDSIREQIRSEQDAAWSCVTNTPTHRGTPAGAADERRRYGNLSSWRKIHLAQNLLDNYVRKHGCEYKLVLRTRPDVDYQKPLKMDRLQPTPTRLYARWNWVKEKYVSDWLAIAGPEAMRVYANQYLEFGALCNKVPKWIPEILTTLQVREKLEHKLLHHQHDLFHTEKICRAIPPKTCKKSQMSSPFVS